MIELKDVTKVYHQGRENEVRAVRGVSLAIEKDRTTVFVGPSGSGKTTLLTLIGGLAKPTSGRILLDGELISNLPEKFLTELRRQHFGFVFQRFNLVRGLSALENVMLPAYPLAPAFDELKSRGLARLEHLHLSHRAGTKVEHLSGGEAQRVAIARALINDPEIIIADEPTANLDTRLAEQFLDVVRQLRADGKTVIMTSHDPRIFGADLVDRVVPMRDGRLDAEEGASLAPDGNGLNGD